LWTTASKRVSHADVEAFDGDARFGMVSVNFSTTRYLKLMLLTLCEQRDLGLIHRLVVVDNGSRDGGPEFLRSLAMKVPLLDIVGHRFILNHARGLRSGARALDRVGAADGHPPNLLLFCDSDVIFRDPATLTSLAQTASTGAALIGEFRSGRNAPPDIQASFFVVRRDVYSRPDIAPIVNHGSPAAWLQQSICAAGLPVVDFPSNHGGYILHRGRTGVAATTTYRPRHHYATLQNNAPHFMNVSNGALIWNAVETRYAPLLTAEAEPDLVEMLSDRLSVLGTRAS
jgi:glycosyltransferase involved in cell wall biosynthesis